MNAQDKMDRVAREWMAAQHAVQMMDNRNDVSGSERMDAWNRERAARQQMMNEAAE